MKNSKSLFLILVLSLITAFSCEDEADRIKACGVENPVENLPWLKAMIDSFDPTTSYYPYLYISQGQYLGETVFVFGNCCPFCDSIVPVYNCDGDVWWYASEYPDRKITDSKIIWKPLSFHAGCN